MRTFRKKDYIITFLVIAPLYLMQLYKPTIIHVVVVVGSSIISALVIGTISNMVLPNKKTQKKTVD